MNNPIKGMYSQMIGKTKSEKIHNNCNRGPSKEIVSRRVTPHAKRSSSKPRAITPLKLSKFKAKPESPEQDNTGVIEPKLFLPFNNTFGQAPRKVIVDRKIRELNSQNINAELNKLGINFKKNTSLYEKYFKLEWFDDESLETRVPLDYIKLATDPITKIIRPIPAKVLILDGDNIGEFQKCSVLNYIPKTEEFVIQLNSGNHVKVNKLYILFQIEDSRHYALRIKNALDERAKAIKLIEYNFYIDKMPINDLPSLDANQQKRIIDNLNCKNNKSTIKKSKFRKQKPTPPCNLCITLMNFYKYEYARCHNKLTFFAYMKHPPEYYLKWPDYIPLYENIKHVPYSGYYFQVNKERFKRNRDQYRLKTLWINNQICEAMVKIYQECLNIETQTNLFQEAPIRIKIEDYKQLNKSYFHVIEQKLSITWLSKIEYIVVSKLKDSGIGWYNLKESNKESYEFSKLNIFLNIISYKMQNSLFVLAKSSVSKFYNTLKQLTPEKIEIKSSTEVTNHYKDKEIERNALFQVDLIETNNKKFSYSHPLKDFADILMHLFEEGIGILSKVERLERYLYREFFKTEPFLKLKAPNFTHKLESFESPTYEERKKGVIADENIWLYKYRYNIQQLIYDSIIPPNQYLDKLNKYEIELKLNAEDYYEKHYGELQIMLVSLLMEEDGSDECKRLLNYDANKLSNDIEYHYTKIQEISDAIPKDITIGLYYINCRDLRNKMINKHTKIAEKIKYLIYIIIRYQRMEAKKFKLKIIADLSQNPELISEISSFRKYMETIPDLVNQLNVMIDSINELYAILEGYLYPFSEEEIDKKFMLMLYCKEVYDKRDLQDGEMMRKRNQFLDQLQKEKEFFDSDIKEVINLIDDLASKPLAEWSQIFIDLDKFLEESSEDFDYEGTVAKVKEYIFYKYNDIYDKFHY